MSKPLAIDLYCGLGGWTEGLLAEGYDVVGFDVERHQYGELKYPAQLVLADVLALHGRQFATAALIVASPPCQAYSYRAMPWKKAKALPPPDNALFDACFRIQREAISATERPCSQCDGYGNAGGSSMPPRSCDHCGGTGGRTRLIPLVVENVRGAQKWVGQSRGKYGSFHLWGDVPALMPIPLKRGVKVGGLDWNGFKRGDPHYKGQAFNTITTTRELTGHKNAGGSWFRVAHNTTSGKGRNPDGRPLPPHTPHMTNPDEHVRTARGWFGADNPSAMRQHSSKSNARKRATALISKIPLELSRHIARVYYPHASEAA